MNHDAGDPAPAAFRFVSLGADCQPACQIRKLQPSNVTTVFDWVTSQIQHVGRLIENDFEGFLDKANMWPVYHDQTLTGAMDARYRIGLTHDFERLEDDDIRFVQDTYRLRIRWFRNLFDPRRPPPYFVRRWHPRDGYEGDGPVLALFQQLRRKRPDIRLLYLHADPDRPPTMEDGYRSIFLRQQEPFAWQGDDVAWRRILTDFAVRPFEGDRQAFVLPRVAFPGLAPRFG